MPNGEEIEILVDVAVLGEQADQFLRSDVGQYLVKRADIEIEEGVAELKIVNCNDAPKINEIQTRIYRAESVKVWLREAIMDGLRATEVLESREE